MKRETLQMALEALEIYAIYEGKTRAAAEAITAIQAALAQPVEEWQGQSNIESPHNACQHRSYCKQLKEKQ